MLLLIANVVNMDYWRWVDYIFPVINICQLGFSFLVFSVLIEYVPIDLKNLYVNSGCWALRPFHGGWFV